MGCHSDSGYAMQSQGFESQMVVGESFEAIQHINPHLNTTESITWNRVSTGDEGTATFLNVKKIKN